MFGATCGLKSEGIAVRENGVALRSRHFPRSSSRSIPCPANGFPASGRLRPHRAAITR
jgi:hypothetical protein